MMKKSAFLFVLFFGFLATQSYAQFTGKIQINSYAVKAGHKQKSDDGNMTLYITPKRLLLQGTKGYKMGGTMKADGILIRNDKNDVILLTNDNKGLQITQSRITMFVNMISRFKTKSTKPNDPGVEVSFKRTGKTKKIDGYKCAEFIFTSNDKPHEHMEAWMTKALDINWGLLKSTWNHSKKNLGAGSDWPIGLILNKGYFPIKIKQYKNDSLSNVTIAHVTPTSSARSKVNLPSNVQVVGMMQYFMQKMQQGMNQNQ